MAEMKTIGVVGGGQMGSGIAQLGVVHGFQVWLLDQDPQALARSADYIAASIRRLVSKRALSQAGGDDALRSLHCTSSLEELRSSDFVIEAIVESEDVKKQLFRDLDKIVKPSAVLASNTSSISITRLASATTRPHQVVGMHFMNPPPVMKLVEIIRAQTHRMRHLPSRRLLLKDNEFSTRRFGKTVVCSQDYSGFIINRILMPMINEAFHTLYTGVATKEDIDAGMKLGTNQPMGPLELADFIGLDVCLSIMRVLQAGLGDSKYAPCPLLVQYVDAGRLGRKRGIGVYDYRKVPELVKPSARL